MCRKAVPFLLLMASGGASDTTAPTVSIGMSQAAFTAGQTATVTFTFSEVPTGFTAADVTADNGSMSAVSATGDPLVFTATFTPTANVTDVTNVITVGTGWTDPAGNPPAGATTSANYTVDTNNYDFSVLSNGAIPSGLTGSTWAVVSGQAVNTPTLGAELLTDPSLEANYTAGKCDTLAKDGTPTLAESADAHAGSKSQEFTGTAANEGVYFPAVGSMTGKWLQYSGWSKRTVGTASKTRFARVQNGFPSGFIVERTITSAAYEQKIQVFKAYAASFTGYGALTGTGGTDTVIVDDFSLKEITAAEMYATKTYASADATVRAYLGALPGNNGSVGIVSRLDSASNPQNYILVGVEAHRSTAGAAVVDTAYISMAKVVAGTLTVLISPVDLSALVVNGDYIEVVCSGNDVSMYYNGVQKGTTQTVSDAGITSNTLFGFFGAGGVPVNRFF
jgi:hypothetical protein